MARYKAGFTALFVKWMINTVALFVVVKTVKGLEVTASGVDGFLILAATAAVIGVINVLIKPVVLLLTLPINIMSFGLFTLVINGAMLALAGLIVPGFRVTSFWGAVIGALIFSVLSLFFGMFADGGSTGGGTKVHYRIID